MANDSGSGAGLYVAQVEEALALMPMSRLQNAGVTRRELRLLFTGALLALRVPFEDARNLSSDCVQMVTQPASYTS